MASVIKQAGLILSLLMPQGFYVFKRWLKRKRKASRARTAQLTGGNTALRNRHKGERCFILGNGPSNKRLDLSKLKGENVISVSNGYLFAGYADFAPKYHCVPQITYGLMTEADTVKWFTEMHDGLVDDALLFLSTNEAAVVQRSHLFEERDVRYLNLGRDFDDWPADGLVDISRDVPAVYSVPIMALMIAMYLGFEEIVLLGVDHDQFRTSKYEYAFELKALNGKDITLKKDGSSNMSRYEEFRGLFRLWQQYRNLGNIAEKNGIRIYNSTAGGELDEFPRKDFDEWFAQH